MEKEQSARDRWLTEDEEARLFVVAVAWVRELLTFTIHTGMRRGEILALTWAGVDFTHPNRDCLSVEKRGAADNPGESNGIGFACT